MLEFANVEPQNYTDPVTLKTESIRLIHYIDTTLISQRELSQENKDIDLISYDEFGNYDNVLNIAESNATSISELEGNLQYAFEVKLYS